MPVIVNGRSIKAIAGAVAGTEAEAGKGSGSGSDAEAEAGTGAGAGADACAAVIATHPDAGMSRPEVILAFDGYLLVIWAGEINGVRTMWSSACH